MADNEELLKVILRTEDKVEACNIKITDVDKTLTIQQDILDHHVKRTDQLQEMVEPLHKKFISDKAVETYRAEFRQSLMWWIKLPGALVASLVTIGIILAWLMEKV